MGRTYGHGPAEGWGNRSRRGWEGSSPWEGSWGGDWPSRHGRPGHGGPPPWLAGLFGLAQQQTTPRGPRVRRGDVRAAILDVLRDEPRNGYQVITEITDRSGGAWRPSPGSVYPTLQQLEDEGLVETTQDGSRRVSRLTDAGREYVEANPDELADVWRSFGGSGSASAGASGASGRGEYASLKPEIGQVMNAAWQIITTGTDHQRREAIKVLIEARKGLYGILAEGDPAEEPEGDLEEGHTPPEADGADGSAEEDR
jgi:DNA-binding PadR family transcriptional regulator